jgi:RimJ/RimL family protein N-acetyltransferase
MVFSASGPLSLGAAQTRFDHMLAITQVISFGKQPIIEISTGSLIGYVGVDEFEFRGERRLEFGYRLVREARGHGYATEAPRAMLEVARKHWRGELLAFIDPLNAASRNVLIKSGFEFVESTEIKGGSAELYGLVI